MTHSSPPVCVSTVYWIPFITFAVRFLVDWFYASRILETHSYSKYYANTNRLWFSLFGSVLAALISFISIAIFLFRHHCPTIWAGVGIVVFFILTAVMQHVIVHQVGVSKRAYEQFLINQAENSQTLNRAIRSRHWCSVNFRAWINSLIESQRVFICETKKRLQRQQ